MLGQLVHVFVGGWNANFLFLVFDSVYQALRFPRTRLVRLDAWAKDDLMLAAVLAPLGVTEIDAPILPPIFALDASPDWGAVCSAPVHPETARALWTRGNRRGGYTQLDVPARCLLRKLVAVQGADEKVLGSNLIQELSYSSPKNLLGSL